MFQTIKQAEAAVGGLSNPDKMPCFGWSIPAIHCRIGSRLRGVKGSVCEICYALKSMYLFPVVVAALERRFGILNAALADPGKRLELIDAFVFLLNTRRAAWKPGRRNDARYFRWHDAGDLQSVEHLALIAEIAEQTPEVSHWLPTRELPTISAYLREFGPLPANLRVRASAAMVGSRAPTLLGVGAGSTSHATKGGELPAGSIECGAWKNDGHCGWCRKCWEDPSAVSYPIH